MGSAPDAPRKRGRPKGSTNKRPAQLQGFIAARYGATAAQQAAALCMVTPAELKAAGGSMAKAMVAKAADLVEIVRKAQAERDQEFRQVIRDEFERLLLDVKEVTAKELRQALDVSLKRVKEAGSGFSLREALELMNRERAALLPYTDQRQPQAVELSGKGMAPSVVLMGAAPAGPLGLSSVEKAEVFDGAFSEVSPSKSHDDGDGVERLQLFGPPPAD